jgi:phage host-nuclease inhibitor protein Gam
MTKPKKLKAEAAKGVMQSRDEVVDAIAAIGRHVRERTRIETAMNDELAGIRAQFEGLAQPHGEAIKALSDGVQAWCEAHRAELTDGGKTKTAQLPTGEVKWRTTPPSVSVKGADAVLALLSERGLQRFIRTKTEVNKEAFLNEPEEAAKVPGVTISQREEFVIEPFETALAEAAE